MTILYQSLLECTNAVLNQAFTWIKQIIMSHKQKFFSELIQIPCKPQTRLWRKKRLGLNSPLCPFLHPCLWWSELPSQWSPAYDLAFLNTYLELLNNQSEQTTAFLLFGLGWGFFGQSNLVISSHPTVKDIQGEKSEIIGKDSDFMWSWPCQSPGQKRASEQDLQEALYCFSD